MEPRADHVPIVQESFRGLYSRGVSDSVPPAFFTDCLNNKFGENEVSTREGLVFSFSSPLIVRFAVYKRLNETPRYIYLDTNGSLWDSLTPLVPIYTDALFVDFSMVNYSNRAYITPHNRIKGITSKPLLVYDGTGPARSAAGSAPSGFTLTVTESVTSGNIEAGIHLFAVAYLTSTGFITAPGPAIPGQLTATGGFEADMNLPIGGSSIIGRVLLATKAIPVDQFTGNPFGYEYFFIPNETIANNTDVTATVSFFDSDLLDSADYLFDNLPIIPAGLGVFVYNNRLGTWAEAGNEYTVRLSQPADPESFSDIDGFFTVDPADGGNGVKNLFEFRKNLYILQSNKIYVTADNGDAPGTWDVNILDKSAGTECFGVSCILDARGLNNDRVWIADRSGILNFNGTVVRPELTWNIEDLWKRINKTYFNLVQIVDDPINHRLFATVPLDAATAISHIFYADYSKAFTVYGTIDQNQVKWSIWTFQANVLSMAGDTDSTTGLPIIHFALDNHNIYIHKQGLTNDASNAIVSFIKTSLKSLVPGWIHHFGFVKLRLNGSGTLRMTMYGEDASNTTVGPTFTMAGSPGMELDDLINFTNEKMSAKFGTTSIDEYYTISRIDLYCKEVWLRRGH